MHEASIALRRTSESTHVDRHSLFNWRWINSARVPVPHMRHMRSFRQVVKRGGLEVLLGRGGAREVLSYDFSRSLFRDAFLYALLGGVMTPGIAIYVAFLATVSIITGLSACPADPAPPTSWSSLLGNRGCWAGNVAPLTYSDISLLSLTSFLLSLLANNVANQWWTMRTMLQEAINVSVSAYTELIVLLDRRIPNADRDFAVAAFKRRLRVAFQIALIAARTDVSLPSSEAFAAFKTLEEPSADGRPPLLLPAEAAALGDRRRSQIVLGWALRDVQVLCDKGKIPMLRMGDFHASLSRLRVLYNDIPFMARVQLPFAATSLTACVVHVTLWQMTYVSASLIGDGVATPGQSIKAVSGIVSIIVLPMAFLCILRLQVLLSQPFGQIKSPTNFPTKSLIDELDIELDYVDNCLDEDTLAMICCLTRPELPESI